MKQRGIETHLPPVPQVVVRSSALPRTHHEHDGAVHEGAHHRLKTVHTISGVHIEIGKSKTPEKGCQKGVKIENFSALRVLTNY